MFYIVHVSSQLDCSKRFILHPPADLCIPAPTQLLRLKHSSRTAITSEDYSLTFPPPLIVRYSFIQLSELGHSGEYENAQTLNQ